MIVQLSVLFRYSVDRSFCVHFIFFVRSGENRKRVAIASPRAGNCPLQDRENRDKRGKEGRWISRDAKREEKS